MSIDPNKQKREGSVYAKRAKNGQVELFFLDNTGVKTQITEDGYLNTANSLRGIGLYEQDTDPASAPDKGFVYVKDDAGDTELFYMDSSGSVAQMTQDGSVLNSGMASHTLGSANHTADTLDNLDSKVSDATLIDISQLDSYKAAQNIPMFENDANDAYSINAVAKPTASSTLSIRLGDGYVDDGYLYYATAPLTCDIDSYGVGGRDATETAFSTGLWNIFAVVDSGDTFGLVASQETHLDGPPSHPKFKYLWTVLISSTSPTVIDPFLQVGDWFYQDSWDSTYEVFDETTSSTSDPWVTIDGYLETMIPLTIVDKIDFSIYAEVDAAGTTEEWRFWIAATSSQPSIPRRVRWLNVSPNANSFDRRINAGMLSFNGDGIGYYLEHAVGSESITIKMGLRGYRNALYPG